MPRAISFGTALLLALGAVVALGMLSLALMQEPPVGAVEGRVVADETGRPIADARVWLTPKHGPNEYPDSRYASTDTDGSFRFSNVTPGDYTIAASAQAHDIPEAAIEVGEGYVETRELRLKPGPPFIWLQTSQNVFTAKEEPQLSLHGFTKAEGVSLAIYRVNPDKFLAPEAEPVRRAVLSSYEGVDPGNLRDNPAIDSVETRSIAITKRDSEGIYRQDVKLDGLAPGIYLVVASADGVRASNWLSVTDLALVTKTSGASLLVYAVRPESGEPVRGATVQVLQGSTMAASGATDASGLCLVSFKPETGAPRDRLIYARSGDSAAFVRFYSYEQAPNPGVVYAYTERPVYRPGQQVHLKGIVRRFIGDAYKLPEAANARVEVQDPRGTLVYAGNPGLTKFGSFSTSFRLPDYAPTGQYDVNCTCSGKTETASFAVEAYRKPEMGVAVELPKKRCTRGETVRATIRATYYFGAPVANAKVSYTVERSEHWWFADEEDYEDYGYEDYGGYGEAVKYGETRTGPDGTAEVEFTADWETPEDSYYTPDQDFTVSAYVTDPSGQEASSEASILATQGDYRIALQPDCYVVAVGKSVTLRATAMDYNGKPRKGVKLGITAVRSTWRKGKESSRRVASANVRTNESGEASFTFKPSKPGSYTIRASARDKRGNLIKSSDWLWVSGEGDYGGYRYPDLKLVLDKKTYNPGEKAKLLINSKEKGQAALLTVEGRRLFMHKVIRLSGGSDTVEIPVESGWKPNFYVRVSYVKNKRLVSQEARARVSLDAESLNVTVTADKKRYLPQEKATYTVKTTDKMGRPTSAEVSLGVVDEAIYAVREDGTPPILGYFYARQPNSVQTGCSVHEVYLSGDKAGFTGRVRKDFKDTAFWTAHLVTGANGEARASLTMPDNLTTWRATARACTLATAVGECRSKVVCSKDLLVRIAAPRFLVQKDRCVIKALVHNYLPSEQTVTVDLKVSNLSITSGGERRVRIPSGDMKTLQWRVTAKGFGSATITAYAVSPAAKDAMEITIPVQPRGQRRVQSVAGSMRTGSATRKLTIVRDAVPGASEIRVRLAPSIASTMLGSLSYLAHYPYGCTEQTMSAFLPDVVIWRTLKELNITNTELQRVLPDMVAKGLNRLYDFQNSDGGWGWCTYGDQDLWMTSYVVYGLVTAQSAGFEVNADVLRSGLSAVETALRTPLKPKEDPGNHIFGLYVISQAGKSDVAWTQLQQIPEGRIRAPRDLAYAALITAQAGQTDPAKAFLDKLWKRAVRTNGDTFWKPPEVWYDVPTETTAVALLAIVKVTPDDARIPSIIRWLLGERIYNHWHSTRDTAITLYALCDYLKHSSELQPDFTAEVTVNGAKAGSVKFDPSMVFAPEREIVVPAALVKPGANSIQVAMSGTGSLYYTLQLTQYVTPARQRRSASRLGLTVTRRYIKIVGDRRIELAGPNVDLDVGDILRVRLVIRNTAKRVYRRLIVEDYLPAGCEAYDRGRLETWEWDYWYNDKDTRDERVSFYVDSLPEGTHVLEYEMRAATPGRYCALPPIAEGMYQPAISASGTPATVTIQ